MAYLTNSTPPRLSDQAISEQVGRQWRLEGTDAVAAVQTAGYISDGGKYGMKVNDLVFYTDTNLNIVSSLRVASALQTTPYTVDLADATTIGVAANTQ